MNEYDKLLLSLWETKDLHEKLMPNSNYNFNDYVLDLQLEIKAYCDKNGISLSENVRSRF